MPALQYSSVTLGCDPELFFEKDGKIVGSEKIVRKGFYSSYHMTTVYPPEIVEDGVQLELHPKQSTCRSLLGDEIARAMSTSRLMAKKEGADLQFKMLVKVKKAEMDTLGARAKSLGCDPSFYIDKPVPAARFKAAAKKLTRCGGGHIHFGMYYDNQKGWVDKYPQPELLVKLLDLLLGNTCVLLDRDPDAIKRRQVYGRAGEYRLPTHGVEYRTLSNFWFRAYPVYSFVFGLARQTQNLWAHEMKGYEKWASEMVALVPRDKVARAINTNSFDLAMENFKAIEPMIKEVFKKEDTTDHDWTLKENNIGQFLKLVDKGLDTFFPKTTESIMRSWLNERYDSGWNLWKEKHLK